MRCETMSEFDEQLMANGGDVLGGFLAWICTD